MAVLKRISGVNRDKIAGGWRELDNEERHNVHSLPGIIRIIKSRKIRRGVI
jgi:hypothetical protein